MRPFVLSAAALALGLLVLLLGWALRDDAVQGAPERRALIESGAVVDPTAAELMATPPLDSPVSDEPGSLRRTAQSASEPGPDPASAPPPMCALQVVDDAGTPLADASVTSTIDSRVERTTTDTEGRCTIVRPIRKQRWHLFVEHEGHFHAKAYYVPGDERTVVLRRTRRLEGRVVDAEAEAPLANARVRFVHSTCKRCEPDERRTDGAGSFTFEALPVAYDVTLLADAEGYAGGVARIRIDPDAESAPCIMRLERARRVELYAFDALTRAPVAGARLMPTGPTCGADGMISLELARSEVQPYVWVAAPGYLETRGSASVSSEGRYEVPMLTGATLTGVVRHLDGTPIPGVTVTLRQDHARMAREGLLTQARIHEVPEAWNIQGEHSALLSLDATGSYVAPGLAPRTAYSALVRRPGFEFIELALPPTGAPGSTTTADIVIERPAEVRFGRWAGATRLNGAPLEAEVNWQAAGRSGSATTDAAGRFTMDEIPLGRVTARVTFGDRFQPFPFPHLTAFEVVIPSEGALERDLDIVFETRATKGRVRTPDGAPLAGVGVTADGLGGSFRERATTDDTGAFSVDLPVVEDVRYRIFASNAGVGDSARDVEAGATGIELTLPRAAHARVRVLDSDGRPRTDWNLVARSLDAPQYEVHLVGQVRRAPTVDGWFEVELPEGDLELEARRSPARKGDEHVLATTRALLVPGVRTDIELVVEPR